MSNWSLDIETILDKIRVNATSMSEYHKKKYYYFKSLLKYFRIPTIILSAFSSVVSVGLQPYLFQGTILLVRTRHWDHQLDRTVSGDPVQYGERTD
jgi:hypothetical protein